ncbi:MAG: metallophosphoesterase [Comamonadaceae bacterium]|nr:metallophosphoesterase [Comamonadaceae bacterium]
MAVGDVHGAYEEFTAILQTVGLIDGRRAWTGGTATLVQTGDVVDRGPKQRECLDLLMDLQRQAPRAGGTVVTLVGNHEVMNVIGDLRYVTPEIFAAFAAADSEQTREKAYKDYLTFLAAHEGHGHEAVPPADGEARQKWMDEHPPGFFEHRDAFGPDGQVREVDPLEPCRRAGRRRHLRARRPQPGRSSSRASGNSTSG